LDIPSSLTDIWDTYGSFNEGLQTATAIDEPKHGKLGDIH